MTIFIFNEFFPVATGFSKRCERIINFLATKQKIVIVCRGHTKTHRTYNSIPIFSFSHSNETIEEPHLYVPFIYELIRNIRMYAAATSQIIRVIRHYRSDAPFNAYVVSSPLTVPILVYAISLIFPIKLHTLEFHDLELELAQYTKKLQIGSAVFKIEKFLEWFLVNKFHRVIVTNEAQKHVLLNRTGSSRAKIKVIYNIPNINNLRKSHSKTREDSILSIGFQSTSFLSYNTDGFLELCRYMVQNSSVVPRIRFVVAGDHSSITRLKRESEIIPQEHIQFLGHVNDITKYYKSIDVSIIPWKKNYLTKTMIPTRFFETLGYGVPVIFPNYGAFREMKRYFSYPLTFTSIRDIVTIIEKLLKTKTETPKYSSDSIRAYKSIYNHNSPPDTLLL